MFSLCCFDAYKRVKLANSPEYVSGIQQSIRTIIADEILEVVIPRHKITRRTFDMRL
jgi:hypothetical protein